MVLLPKKMILTVSLTLFFIPILSSIYFYARGMSIYLMNNYKETKEVELLALNQAIEDELRELSNETPWTWAWLKEWFDVQHGHAKRKLIEKYTKEELSSIWPWFTIYHSAPLTTTKLAWRYFWTGCIRSQSHHFEYLDHVCKS